MAFVHGKSTVVLFDATNLSGYLNSASASSNVETAETTAFGNNSKTYIVGLKDGTISVAGMFDGAVSAIDPILQAKIGVENATVTILPDGSTIGNRATMANTDLTSYDISSPVGDVVSVSAELQADGGVDSGRSLQALTAVSSTGTGTSVDNSASSSNGGVGHLHVTANAHDDTVTIKVQHSADNSTWADLDTFTVVSASTTTSERRVVAAGTTVNRYLRASHTLAGSGDVTYQLSFARR